MSALTDLFTSMANKIRSKVGGSDTYTPTEMVSAIDDVYDAGYADATTPITPSDSSPAAMSANVGYKPTTGGYAIVSSPTSVTPSDSSPVSLTSGTIYKMGGAGYAIESYDSKTPDDTNPPSVSSGEIVKMGGAGYLYATQHTEIETTLWTNASPTSAFSTQDVTLSQDYTNFKRIKLEFRGTTTDATSASVEYLKEDIDNWAVVGVSPTGFKPAGAIPFLYGSQSYMRLIRRPSASSASSLNISVAYKVNSAGNTGSYAIPTKIVGIN